MKKKNNKNGFLEIQEELVANSEAMANIHTDISSVVLGTMSTLAFLKKYAPMSVIRLEIGINDAVWKRAIKVTEEHRAYFNENTTVVACDLVKLFEFERIRAVKEAAEMPATSLIQDYDCKIAVLDSGNIIETTADGYTLF